MNTFRIVQIGCGVVGGPYAQAYKSAGNDVFGIEANPILVEKYQKEFPMFHINDDISVLKDIDFIMISINTPLKGDALDLSYLFSSIKNVATICRNSKNPLVIIRSTVPPLTCKEYKKSLEQELHKPVQVLFQPEFLRACSAYDDAMNPWHVVIGKDKNTDTTELKKLYGMFIDSKKITEMSVEEAEFLKVMHNCFNANKISFFNNCHLLVNNINARHDIDIDVNKITNTMIHTCEGLLNPKYGTKAGHAYYGTCLPKDSAELARLEKLYNIPTTLFQSVVDVNNVVKSMDKEEILDGDFHVKFNQLSCSTN